MKHNAAGDLDLCEPDSLSTGCCDFPEIACLAATVPGRIPASGEGALRIAPNGIDPARIDLSWGASCGSAAGGYAVYEGPIGDFTAHGIFNGLCGVASTSSVGQLPGSGNRYYLVVPIADLEEGSYGLDATGAERPPAAAACMPAQNLGGCL